MFSVLLRMFKVLISKLAINLLWQQDPGIDVSERPEKFIQLFSERAKILI